MADTEVKLDPLIELLISYDVERPETLGDAADKRGYYAARIRDLVLMENAEALMAGLADEYKRFQEWAGDNPSITMSYASFKRARIESAIAKHAAGPGN